MTFGVVGSNIVNWGRYSASLERRDAGIVIGLVNNMPPSAIAATTKQFTDLVTFAPHQNELRFRYFSLSSIRRGDDHYEDIDALWKSSLDGMIVTGAEPQAASMTGEPLWPMLKRLVDWAGENTISTIWSCFAAHAAVFRLDGLKRQRFDEKLSGVFQCTRVTDHSVVSAAPTQWQVPHSRYNTLSEDLLMQSGYTILSCGPRIGADTFLKHSRDSLFLFFQGHPEYGRETLFREYCRDIDRFRSGQRRSYPEIPDGYFTKDIISYFATLKEKALLAPSGELLSAFDELLVTAIEHSWQEPAQQLSAGWLSYIATQKSKRGELRA